MPHWSLLEELAGLAGLVGRAGTEAHAVVGGASVHQKKFRVQGGDTTGIKTRKNAFRDETVIKCHGPKADEVSWSCGLMVVHCFQLPLVLAKTVFEGPEYCLI